MKKRRSNKEGLTEQGLTNEGLTSEGTRFKDGIEYVPASFVEGLHGRVYQSLPERPRYLTLSDGQVMDRLNQPHAIPSGSQIARMKMANEARFNFHHSEGIIPESLRVRLT